MLLGHFIIPTHVTKDGDTLKILGMPSSFIIFAFCGTKFFNIHLKTHLSFSQGSGHHLRRFHEHNGNVRRA